MLARSRHFQSQRLGRSFFIGLLLVASQGQAAVSPQLCHFLFLKKPPTQPPAVKSEVGPAPTNPGLLKRIVGQIGFDVRTSGKITANFLLQADEVTRRKEKDGKQLIATLMNHLDFNSPTSLRVEEKAVVPTASLNEFLRFTQSSEFADQFNGGVKLQWESRDIPPAGHEFVTITEYGKNLAFALKESKATFVVKPRFRKYYDFPTEQAGQISAYKPVMGNLTAFELKMTSAAGDGSPNVLATEASVFKPRIMITDDLADALKRMSTSRFDRNELTLIANSVKALLNKQGQPLNDPAQVDSMFAAVEQLLQIDPTFLVPTFAVKYNRTSYKAKQANSEYQFTADRGVQIFHAKFDQRTIDMVQYLNDAPTFSSKNDQVFVELKTPVPDKQAAKPFYKALYSNMTKDHIEGYKMGSGKYAIARYVEAGLLDQHIDQTLFKQGVNYWLIKGTGYMDAIPKENNLLNEGKIEVAFPVTSKRNRIFRVVFRYHQYHDVNGGRPAILDRISFIDEQGFRIESEDDLDDFIRATSGRKDEVLGIDVEGTIVPFRVRLTSDEVQEYHDFFRTYFVVPSGPFAGRRMDIFDQFADQAGLRKAYVKMKADNALDFITRRTRIILFGALAIWAVDTGMDAFTLNLVREKSYDGEGLLISGFSHAQLGSIRLMALLQRDGSYLYVFADKIEDNILNQESVMLMDEKGNRIHLKQVAEINGQVLFTLLPSVSTPNSKGTTSKSPARSMAH